MTEAVGWRDDPRWLEMPSRKREEALRRMEALIEYERLNHPSREDRERIAAAMGVGRSRLFDLLRTWRRTGSPVDLAPYADPVRQTRSTMATARAHLLKTLSDEVTMSATDRTLGALLDRVRERWDSAHGAAPARATIRRYLAEAGGRHLAEASMRKKDAPVVGILDGGLAADRRLPEFFKSEGTEVAWRFGDVLVVDHMALDLWVASEPRPRRPLVTLAIDLFTERALGAVLHVEPPAPVHVAAAIRAAQDRTAGWLGEPRRPRVSMSATFAAEWDALVSELTRAGLGVSLKRTSRLQHGAPGKRLLHGRLGRLRLLARKSHLAEGGAAEHNPARHATLTFEEAGRVLEANMAGHVADVQGGAPLTLGSGDRQAEEARRTRMEGGLISGGRRPTA